MIKNINNFVMELRAVIEWTGFIQQSFDFSNESYGLIFRTVNPLINNKPLYAIDEYDTAIWNHDPYNNDNFKMALDIAKSQRSVNNIQASLEGRILCHETRKTTHDGIVIAETMGFFDESDVPPIDTWFYFDDNYRDSPQRALLYCWIPSRFEDVVQKGIDAEMLGSNKWLDEVNPILNGQSRQLVAMALASR